MRISALVIQIKSSQSRFSHLVHLRGHFYLTPNNLISNLIALSMSTLSQHSHFHNMYLLNIWVILLRFNNVGITITLHNLHLSFDITSLSNKTLKTGLNFVYSTLLIRCMISSSISPLTYILEVLQIIFLGDSKPHFYAFIMHEITKSAFQTLHFVLLNLNPLSSRVCLHTFGITLTTIYISLINTIPSANNIRQ